jgi:hypothetical protein
MRRTFSLIVIIVTAGGVLAIAALFAAVVYFGVDAYDVNKGEAVCRQIAMWVEEQSLAPGRMSTISFQHN